MATLTKTFREVNGSSSSAMSTWTVQVSCSDMQITGSYFDITPTITAKYSAVSGKSRASVTMYAGIYSQTADYGYDGSWAGNTYKTVPRTNGSMRLYTASFFTSSNPSVRTISLPFRSDFVGGSENSSGTLWGDTGSVSVSEWGTLVNITLNVPPTFTASNWSKDTPVYIAGLTTVSVDVSNATAKYGGNITSAKLTVGSQSESISGNGTISMTLQNAGTFTPTVTVTDSRGQTTTENVTTEPITVLQYENPTVSFDVFRTDDTGVRADEGHNGLVTATFTYMDAVSSLAEPEVQINGYDISQTIGASITWYTALTQSGAVDTTTEIDDWSDIASGATVYGLLDGNYDVTGNFSEGESYLIGLIAKDSRNKTSALITQTLSTAFYTIDFQAGGKEIAFGAPANDDITDYNGKDYSDEGLFKCNMGTAFTDMTSEEVQDFVDGLNVGGSSLNELIAVQELSKSYTVTANTVLAVDFTPSKTGYTFVGVVGFSTGHGSVLLQQTRKINESTIRMSVRNITSSSISSTALVYVLFVKVFDN